MSLPLSSSLLLLSLRYHYVSFTISLILSWPFSLLRHLSLSLLLVFFLTHLGKLFYFFIIIIIIIIIITITIIIICITITIIIIILLFYILYLQSYFLDLPPSYFPLNSEYLYSLVCLNWYFYIGSPGRDYRLLYCIKINFNHGPITNALKILGDVMDDVWISKYCFPLRMYGLNCEV